MKLNPFKKDIPSPNEESTSLVTYDESVLQQGRFWMKTVTWTLIGTTVFGVAWLALNGVIALLAALAAAGVTSYQERKHNKEI